jgi:hypothetical protein
MLFHKATVDKLRRMNFDSGLMKAVSEQPDIIAGLQLRMESSFKTSLYALQVGNDSRILIREGGSGLPTFRAIGNNLPKPVRHPEASVADIFSSAKRLGVWFASEEFDVLTRHLMVEI